MTQKEKRGKMTEREMQAVVQKAVAWSRSKKGQRCLEQAEAIAARAAKQFAAGWKNGNSKIFREPMTI